MKNLTGLTVLAFALALFAPGAAFAEDEFVTAQDHATLGGLYEKKAAEQDSLVNEHSRMIDSDFVRKNPSATAQSEMRLHCNAIVAKAKALKEELLNAAEWHKKQV